jgi:tetratricopeptide (TPR) repeat protein
VVHPPRKPINRGLLIAGAAVLALLLAAAAGLYLFLPRGASKSAAAAAVPSPPPVAGPTLAETQVQALLHTGQEMAKAGDWPTALAAYQEVERLSPNRPGVAELIAEAQRQSGEQGKAADQQRELDTSLETARKAFAERRYDEASTAAAAAVTLATGNPALQPGLAEAQNLQAKAQEGRQKQQKALQAAKAARAADDANRAKAAAKLPVEPARPAPVSAPAPPAEAPHDATLSVAFRSEFKNGTLIVYVDGKVAIHEKFRFPSGSGTLQRDLKVPAGPVTLLVLVTPEGQKARVQNLSGNFPGGSTRRLDVHIGSNGEVSAQLN